MHLSQWYRCTINNYLNVQLLIHQSEFLNLKKKSVSSNSLIILWSCQSMLKLFLIYFLLMISLVKVPVGGHCILDEQCQGGEHSAACELGRCVCRTGFVLINLECHEGELEILYKKYKLKRGTFNFRSFHNILICYRINLTSEKLMTYDVFPFHIISSQIFLLT